MPLGSSAPPMTLALARSTARSFSWPIHAWWAASVFSSRTADRATSWPQMLTGSALTGGAGPVVQPVFLRRHAVGHHAAVLRERLGGGHLLLQDLRVGDVGPAAGD